MLKTVFEEFVSDPKRHMAYEREALALQASELILELMEKEGVTKSQMAELVGKSRALITQLMSGSRNMTVHTLSDLAFALGHKIELEALPLRGSRSAAQYVAADPSEKQKCFFGTSHDSTKPSPGDEMDHEEEEAGDYFPVAA
jgi:transcriptional regulator with XRE-family HTH domain